MTPEQLKEINSLLESLIPDLWFLSDCEGELQIWQEGVLRNVTRDENGEITGYRPPANYQPSALIGEWELNTWDPGQDEDDDRRRATAQFIVAARKYMPALVAEVEQLRAERDQLKRGGAELGKTVEFLAELIKDAFVRGADDPIDALHMLGNVLAEVLGDEGGLSADEHNRVYQSLETRRSDEEKRQRDGDERRRAEVSRSLADIAHAQRPLTEHERAFQDGV